MQNLALEYLNQDTQFVLEMIGHAWVAEDHIEVRVQRMLAIESEIGCKLGGLGSIVIESDLPLQRVGKWVEAALSCPLWFGPICPIQGRRANKDSTIHFVSTGSD